MNMAFFQHQMYFCYSCASLYAIPRRSLQTTLCCSWMWDAKCGLLFQYSPWMFDCQGRSVNEFGTTIIVISQFPSHVLAAEKMLKWWSLHSEYQGWGVEGGKILDERKGLALSLICHHCYQIHVCLLLRLGQQTRTSGPQRWVAIGDIFFCGGGGSLRGRGREKLDWQFWKRDWLSCELDLVKGLFSQRAEELKTDCWRGMGAGVSCIWWRVCL